MFYKMCCEFVKNVLTCFALQCLLFLYYLLVVIFVLTALGRCRDDALAISTVIERWNTVSQYFVPVRLHELLFAFFDLEHVCFLYEP